MADDAYITNPDAQQGESIVRKASRAPANINAKVQVSVPVEDSVEEGPPPVPDHHPHNAAPPPKPDALRDPSPRPMADKIGHHKT
jgi:hypothetical protein